MAFFSFLFIIPYICATFGFAHPVHKFCFGHVFEHAFVGMLTHVAIFQKRYSVVFRLIVLLDTYLRLYTKYLLYIHLSYIKDTS